MARFATGDHDAALDIVQDSMLTLARRYGRKPPDEWAPLFQRIMQNRIRDWYRRERVRSRLRIFTSRDEETPSIDGYQGVLSDEPDQRLAATDMTAALERALHELPMRQRQVFLLRVYEGLSVHETAQAMGVSSGSVKTHLSRALGKLRGQLRDHHDA